MQAVFLLLRRLCSYYYAGRVLIVTQAVCRKFVKPCTCLSVKRMSNVRHGALWKKARLVGFALFQIVGQPLVFRILDECFFSCAIKGDGLFPLVEYSQLFNV